MAHWHTSILVILSKMEASDNTKKSRGWSFTLNNYTDDEYGTLTQQLLDSEIEYIIGKEVGEKNNTPHLQGYLYFPNARSFNSVKKLLPKAHIERAKGNKSQNIKYCSKENNFITNIKEVKPKLSRHQMMLEENYKNVIWRPWQQAIISIIEESINPRTIYWIFEEDGNSGKSFLAKYLFLKYNAIIASGKKDNLFHQVKEWLDANEPRSPTLAIVDIPRHDLDYINMGAIEAIKNGFIYSGKYEGGTCAFNHPHVICFANKPPKKNELSLDRWNIFHIEDNNLISVDRTDHPTSHPVTF